MAVKKPSSRSRRPTKPLGQNPVIAVRVALPLYEQIARSAKQSRQSMSEHMQALLSNAFSWQAAFLDRQQMIEEARRIVRETTAECERLRTVNLHNELRRRNWKCDEKGSWTPPEVHGLQPSGFIDEPPQPATQAGFGVRSDPVEAPRARTADEEQRLLEELENSKRQIDAAVGKTRARDAAEDIESDDTAA
jgi:hypothetical protein